jgi:LacI family transcriptional regulator
MNDRVTMAVVARQAGVHPTTVSLALRNHPSLPLATRIKLQALAARMGYQRDPALSALVAYRRNSHPVRNKPQLAYITGWDTRWGWKEHPAHLAFFDGAGSKAAELGYQLEHFWLDEPGLTHRRMSQILHTRGITGLVVASQRPGHDAPLDFEWSKFSAVKIDFFPRQQLLHCVTNDQRASVSMAVQRARAAGYRRIGFVMPHWWDEFVNLAWSAGFLAEQQAVPSGDKIPILYFSNRFRSDRLLTAGPDYLVPRDSLEKWIRKYRPEVILSYSPFVKSRLDELGVSIPREIAFVEIFLEKPDGRLAGIHQNCSRVGELAIEILAGQLHQNFCGTPSIPTTTLVEGTWFDGKSLPARQNNAESEIVSMSRRA